MFFANFIFCSLSFVLYQNWYMWYGKRRKWYLRPIFCPKLTSSHVILQVYVYMRDTCPRGTHQRWRGYHFFIIILMISYIYNNNNIKKKIWGGCHPHFGQGIWFLYNTNTTTVQQSLTWGWAPVCGTHPHVRDCCTIIVLVL